MKKTKTITTNDIHLWSANLTVLPHELANYKTFLNADECERADRFQFAIHQHRFIVARACLRQILSHYLPDTLPKNVPLCYQPQGKPYLGVDSGLTFNLSHAGDLAVYAIGYQRKLGIDIEELKAVDHNALAERFFHPDEYAAIIKASDPTQAFHQIWTRKEAVLKATGHGLTKSLASFSTHGTMRDHIEFENQTWLL